MKLTFTTKLEAMDLFTYNMGRVYSSFNGWVSIALAAVFFWLATQQDILYMLLYIGGGLVVLFYNPVTLWTRSKKICQKDPVLSKELHYEVSEESIHVTQGESEAMLPWDQVYKMTGSQKYVRIYSNRVNAYIIPVRCLKGQYDGLYELAKKCLPGYRFAMKKQRG